MAKGKQSESASATNSAVDGHDDESRIVMSRPCLGVGHRRLPRPSAERSVRAVDASLRHRNKGGPSRPPKCGTKRADARLAMALCLLASCLSRATRSTTARRISSRGRRRRNNTGFYYGIRDDDMRPSSSSSSSSSSLRLPSLSASPLSLHPSGSMARNEERERGERGAIPSQAYDGRSSVSILQIRQDEPPNPSDYSMQISGLDQFAILRDRLVHGLSQSLMQHPSLMLQRSFDMHQRRHWDLGWGDRTMSLLGGGGGSAAIMQEPLPRQYNAGEGIVSTSSITKQQPKKKAKQKARKRRKNNTGFYYGIRDNVLERQTAEWAKTREKLPQTEPRSRDEGKNRQPSALPPKREEETPSANKKKGKRKISPKPKPPKASNPKRKQSPENMSNILLDETMLELRGMREEIVALREELRAVQERLRQERSEEEAAVEGRGPPRWGRGRQEKGRESPEEERERQPLESEPEPEPEREISPKAPKKKGPREKRKHFEQIGRDVERWARDILFEEEDGTTLTKAGDGWKEIPCNKFMKKKFNGDGRSEVYLKWIPDSRDEKDIDSISAAANAKKVQTYPCLKCYTTIDAPLHRVCSFLADESTVPMYNELVVEHAEVEEISPNSKITWCQCPKILIVKPRDFVTYCSHRWLGDGTQVLVNQACEHEDRPGVMLEGQGDVCRAFALRGANFISKDPDDPNKTRITMLSHANPGGGLPQWAMNTAVNAVVQVEPFKFFHRINESVRDYYRQDDEGSPPRTSPAAVPGRSDRPAGIAHMGFTCFWPNGGGLQAESGGAARSSAANRRPSPPPPREDGDAMLENENDDEDDADSIEELDD